MIYRCHGKIEREKNEASERAMKERRDGQIGRRQPICRALVLGPDAQSSQAQRLPG